MYSMYVCMYECMYGVENLSNVQHGVAESVQLALVLGLRGLNHQSTYIHTYIHTYNFTIYTTIHTYIDNKICISVLVYIHTYIPYIHR